MADIAVTAAESRAQPVAMEVLVTRQAVLCLEGGPLIVDIVFALRHMALDALHAPVFPY